MTGGSYVYTHSCAQLSEAAVRRPFGRAGERPLAPPRRLGLSKAETKKRTSQLNDHTHRLTTVLANINTVLANPALTKALDNAEKLTHALTLLEWLEKNGSLQRILAALK